MNEGGFIVQLRDKNWIPHVGRRWWWFHKIGDGSLKYTNLHSFYTLGVSLEKLHNEISIY